MQDHRRTRTAHILGDQLGSKEASGAQECELVQPGAAQPPRSTYTCTAESLHAAKRKEKNMNGREIKQQHHKKGGERHHPQTSRKAT